MESKHPGKIALMHEGEVANIFNDSGDAHTIGVEKYGLDNSALQKLADGSIFFWVSQSSSRLIAARRESGMSTFNETVENNEMKLR